MELLSNLELGFQTALSTQNLLFCFIGVAVGTFVGVLPGIGALAAISMALPLTFYLEPTTALIMLGGIFYGSQYGGSTASILLNLPGTAANVVTCLDGYPLSQQGKAGVALFITTITSFIGGSVGILLLMAFAPTIARFALSFTSAEYFSIMLLGLIAAASLGTGSILKGLAMVAVGVLAGLIGAEITTGVPRFTFGVVHLMDGLSLVAVAMGLFGVAEILNNLANGTQLTFSARSITWRTLVPSWKEMRQSLAPTARGSLIGSVIGALPGAGPAIAAFMAYAVEKRVAKDPSRFGKGAIEGISAPEAANNAAVQTAFIPTLSLGIPGDVVMAVVMGALMLHGIAPGPQILTNQPEMFWGLVASFWIGNVLLLILNIPLIGIWVRIVTIPYNVLYPAILFFICIGAYSARNNVFDVYLLLLFGVLGYFMTLLRYPAAPLLLGFILGPLMEEHLRRTLLIARGSFMPFLERPLSATFLLVAASILLFVLYSAMKVIWRLLRRQQIGKHIEF